MGTCVENLTAEPAIGLSPSSDSIWLPDDKHHVERYSSGRDCEELWLEILEQDSLRRGDLQKHSSLESALAYVLASRLTRSFDKSWEESLYKVFLAYFTTDHQTKRAIRDDLRAASKSTPDIVSCYADCFLSASFLACQAYRVAHKFWSQEDKTMALKISFLAFQATGFNIHPGAKIGSGIAIDFNSWEVHIIGTAVIGDNVTIFENTCFSRENLLPQESYFEMSDCALQLAQKLIKDCFDRVKMHKIILKTLLEDHKIRMNLRDDLMAAGGYNFCSRFLACLACRVARKLWLLGDKSMAQKIRVMAFKAFQTDIHPRAKIGRSILNCTYFPLPDGNSFDKILRLAKRLASELADNRINSFVYKMDKKLLYSIILETSMEDDVRDDLRADSEGYGEGGSGYSRGLLATLSYRVAHKLWLMSDKATAHKIQHIASWAFGVDIHPAAEIAGGLVIDDGATGVAIGKKGVIGDNVTILDTRLYICRKKSLDEESYGGISCEKKLFKLIELGRLYEKLPMVLSIKNGVDVACKIYWRFLSAFPDRASDLIASDLSKIFTRKKTAYVGEFHPEIVNASPGSGHGDEESAADGGGGELHAVQLPQADDNDPAARSTELTSPASINAPFASDQSNQQPPPGGHPSDIEMGDEIVQEEQEFNLSDLAKTFLLVAAEEGLATLAVRFGAGKSLPKNARIVLFMAELCSVAGFLFCSAGYILQRSHNSKPATRLMAAAGGVATICGFIFMMASLIV